MQTDTAPAKYAPGQKPGPQFTRALRRAATRDPACVRDERGTIWRATTHEAHRADVARYATRQQVARTKALQARAAAEAAVKDAQRAYDAIKDGGVGKRLRALGALRHAEHALAWLVAEPLPEVPRVPPAGKPVEVPYVGGDTLVVNRQAGWPAGTRAEHRREFPGGMPADVAECLGARARRCAAREQAQRDRRCTFVYDPSQVTLAAT